MYDFSWRNREAARDRFELLSDLQSEVDRFALDPRGPVTWLAEIGSPYNTAKADTESGILVINHNRLDAIPREIQVAIGVHEYVHFRLRGRMRCELARRHPDVEPLLRERIVPDWLAGDIEIESLPTYVSSKQWRFLYDDWRGSQEIENDRAARALDVFFNLVKLGEMTLRHGEIDHPTPDLDDSYEGQLGTEWDGALGRRYEEQRDEVASLVAVGLALAEDFADRLIDRLAAPESRCQLEEGFANYVACAKTGILARDFRRYAGQDEWKIEMAERIERAEPAWDMVERVLSIKDLFAFGREIGVLG